MTVPASPSSGGRYWRGTWPSGDALAAAIAAALAVAIVGFDGWDGLYFVGGAVLLWPTAAFSIGLYRSDQLASWASAVTEIPRGFVALMLITWPLFGVAASILGSATASP